MDFSNKARVKKNATPTEEQILFPAANKLLKIFFPIRKGLGIMHRRK
jgi:hypothetical protein